MHGAVVPAEGLGMWGAQSQSAELLIWSPQLNTDPHLTTVPRASPARIRTSQISPTKLPAQTAEL